MVGRPEYVGKNALSLVEQIHIDCSLDRFASWASSIHTCSNMLQLILQAGLLSNIWPAHRTHNPDILGAIPGFAGLFSQPCITLHSVVYYQLGTCPKVVTSCCAVYTLRLRHGGELSPTGLQCSQLWPAPSCTSTLHQHLW